MASRTSASTGMMIGLAVSTMLWLGFFVTSIILFARVQKLDTELTLKQNDLDAAVRADERDDRWTELQQQAGGRTGVVRYLDRSLGELTQQVSGALRESPQSLGEKIKAAVGEGGPTLLTLVASQRNEIESLQASLAEAERAREAANSDLLASNDRIEALNAEMQATNDRLNAEIGVYKAGGDQFRADVDDAKAFMNGRVTTIRADSDRAIAGLESQVASLESQLLVANDQLRRFKADQSDQTCAQTSRAPWSTAASSASTPRPARSSSTSGDATAWSSV